MPLRVLLVLRSDRHRVPGGDSELLIAHRQALAALDVELVVAEHADESPEGFDVVHGSNLGPDSLQGALAAALAGVPFVVSPWFGDDAGLVADRATILGFVEPPEDVAARRRVKRLILDLATAVMCSAESEGEMLREGFGDLPPVCVFPVCIAGESAAPNPDLVRRYGGQFVVSVARIEPIKNQLRLIAACESLGLPLVLIGDAHPYEPRYFDLCGAAAGPNVFFTGRLDRHDLLEHVATAKVHALPSWYEQPGMVSLEAAAAGTNVVASEVGALKDYLGEDAWYCHPADVDSITSAVAAAFAAPRRDPAVGQRWVDADRSRGAAALAAAYRFAVRSTRPELTMPSLLRNLLDAERTAARRLQALTDERLAGAREIARLASGIGA